MWIIAFWGYDLFNTFFESVDIVIAHNQDFANFV